MAKRASSGGAADAVEAVATLTELSTRKDHDNLKRFAIVALVDEPERVTPAQMDRWCRELGAPRHWSPRPQGECRRDQTGPPAGGLARQGGAVDRKRRAA